jgi:glutathione S-transferase
MHAGFAALRGECPMNIRRPVRERALSGAAQADVARIEAMWSGCRARHGGPFLFGPFSAADAMYAPVVARFHTYGIKASRDTLGYIEMVMALPAFAEWRAASMAETWIVAEDEADWPTVL